ncbi:MAG: glycosyltransferase family 39 protein [Bryobacteraceae bacterium]|nr:glycosyltransferase family 39 protein [Bryobacteraceae bacterium]
MPDRLRSLPPRWRAVWPVAALLLLAFLIDAWTIRTNSVTFDELAHFRYGRQFFSRQLDRSREPLRMDSKMPVSAMNVLPPAAGGVLQKAGVAPGLAERLVDVRSGRYVTVVFALLLGLLIYRWAGELYGRTAALFALAFFVFSPNLIAHSGLITTEIYSTLAIAAPVYAFWKFAARPNRAWAVLSACSLAAAQLAKVTSLYLYLILPLIFGIRWLSRRPASVRPKAVWQYLLLLAAAHLVIINAGFLFYRSFTPLSQYEFSSPSLRALQRIPLVRDIPVPLPYPYLEGIDLCRHHEQTGVNIGRLYLLGELRDHGDDGPRPFPSYFLVAYLVKEPIALQVLLLLSLAHLWRRRRERDIANREAFLLVPSVFFFVYLSFFFNAQIGIRYLLPAYPFLLIITAAPFARWARMGRAAKGASLALTAWLVVSTLSWFPHFIPYFNELVWDRKQAYRILADSNINWGQDRDAVARYAAAHPDISVEPETPRSGWILVDVNSLVGILHRQDPERYRWLRENHKPAGHINYSHLLFHVPANAAGR